MSLSQKECFINKNGWMISLYVESKYYSRVDLKAFPVLRDRGSLYLEEFAIPILQIERVCKEIRS